jgi:transcriptional regulator with XRE-family HTH domain
VPTRVSWGHVTSEAFLRKMAARLRKARWRLGITQEDAALRAKVTPRYYAEIERGQKNPTVTTLFDIAHAVKVTLADVVDVEGLPRVALDDLDVHAPPRGRKPRTQRRR